MYPSILPTHISFNVIPEDTASFPGEVVNVTDYLYAAASVPVLSGYSTEIFKKINPSRMTLTRMNSAFLAPSKPSMDHPAVCEQVLAPSLQTHSGRQLVGSCRFSSKLHKQSKLEVQPSLEAKPMWAIHTPVPVWGQWLQPHSPLHTPAHYKNSSKNTTNLPYKTVLITYMMDKIDKCTTQLTSYDIKKKSPQGHYEVWSIFNMSCS